MNLSAIKGNESVKELLCDAKKSNRFPHAIIIQGEHGTGKRTMAKLLANALVCRDENSPCGECPSCIRARAGSHPDIRIEEGSGATRSLTVDTAKSIILDAYRMPEEADVSVYLLFVENKMPEITQNKLLKLIEEPPKNTVFIITIPSAESLLPTIRSRSQIFTMRPPSKEEAADYVESIAEISHDEAQRLAELCGGNIGKMLEDASEEADGESPLDIAAQIASAVAERSTESLLEITAPLIKNRKLFEEVLSRLYIIMRDGCMLKAGSTDMLGAAPEAANSLQRLSQKELLELVEVVKEYRRKFERNANMTLLVTSFCSELFMQD